ncbi:hypothetical protein [Pollutimonas thiosulfatoxidans]|uniref:Uncharacterized protein n=1 Tax=Pollutimonas thiosulfatoxidans TaxID=2028345 RepID=A0A410GEI0_9BURK|nr:hypothetical protein [Pollutimonas thiosulfatoxidans]QAA94703.1 hypothetical protein CKA81_13275 [Pollutimonas thiosulfatoxidans]
MRLVVDKKVFVWVMLAAICAACNMLVFKHQYVDFYSIFQGIDSTDGFNNQLVDAYRAIRSGFDFTPYGKDEWLGYVHVVRLITTTPFFVLEKLFGAPGQTIAMYYVVCVSIFTIRRSANIYYFLPLLIFPLVMSWRSALVFLSIIVFLSYYVDKHSGVLRLIMGATLASLSSASLVFIFIATLYLAYGRARRLGALGLIFILYLGFMVWAVVEAKIYGFYSGSVGYSLNDAGPLQSIIMRSTVVVKIGQGAPLKAAIFALFALFLMFKALKVLFPRRRTIVNRLLLFSMFGVLVEGLGVMVIGAMLLLSYSGFRIEPDMGRLPRRTGGSSQLELTN